MRYTGSMKQELNRRVAACAAGFASGLYNPGTVYDGMQRRSYTPKMTPQEHDARYAGWQKAVLQALLH